MKLEYEGKEDSYTFVDSSELRALIEKDRDIMAKVRAQLGDGSRGGPREWAGGMSFLAAMNALTVGDESLVARSDALLAKLEDKLPPTKKKQWQRVVAGQIVVVPEYLTGVPQCMRRRTRVETPSAPVTIFMDLTSSAQVDARDLLKRGIAILALARVLTAHRPVELWAGVAIGSGSYRGPAWSSTLGWRIDTSPLDLARAAFLLSSPAIARGIGYGTAPAVAGHKYWGGDWSWGDHGLHVKTQQVRLRGALGASEMLLIPPVYAKDPLVKDPVGWITRELERLLGQGGEVGSEEWNKENV